MKTMRNLAVLALVISATVGVAAPVSAATWLQKFGPVDTNCGGYQVAGAFNIRYNFSDGCYLNATATTVDPDLGNDSFANGSAVSCCTYTHYFASSVTRTIWSSKNCNNGIGGSKQTLMSGMQWQSAAWAYRSFKNSSTNNC